MKHFYLSITLLALLSACANSSNNREVFMNADYSATGTYVSTQQSDRFGMINEQF